MSKIWKVKCKILSELNSEYKELVIRHPWDQNQISFRRKNMQKLCQNRRIISSKDKKYDFS